MEALCKMQIGLLEGKNNWTTWKYKMEILLRSVKGGTEVVQGKLNPPDPLPENASVEDNAKYEKALAEYTQADSHALLSLTVNMTQETLEKVLRFSTAREVWLELHRMFDGQVEDKAFDLCSQFFSYSRQQEDDIATHTSKLKTLWKNLQSEMAKEKLKNGSTCKCDLPELLLVCKILETLPSEYFSFKSSWMMMSSKERTVDNLTNQLVTYEKALQAKNEGKSNTEVLFLNKKYSKERIWICNYCKQKGHKVRQCAKWKADGRPPKPEKESKEARDKGKNMSLMILSSQVLFCESDEDWYVDNGATNHITNHSEWFDTYIPFQDSRSVTTANGYSVTALGQGDIEVETEINNKKRCFTLKNVWFVPEIKKNLFSTLSAQDKNPNSQFVSTAESCSFRISGEEVLFGKRSRCGGLYKLFMRCHSQKKNLANLASSENVLQIYHERFGHQNKRHVKTVLKNELNIDVKLDSELCEGCIYGKAHVLKFGTRERADRPGARIHTDVCGMFDCSKAGYRYFVCFKDDFSRYRYIYFMKNKSEVVNKLQIVLAQIKTAGYVVQELLSDNGGEFDNREVRAVLDREGIQQRLVMPYTPQQNGCAERENRTVVETARALMHARDSIFDQSFWAEMVNTAAYILNRTGKSSVEGKTPFEIWFKRKPKLDHFRVIGSSCYAQVPKKGRKKFDKKAEKGVLIGYEEDGYRIWSFEQKRLIRSRNVTFDEFSPLKTVDQTQNSLPSPFSDSGFQFFRCNNKEDTNNLFNEQKQERVQNETESQPPQSNIDEEPTGNFDEDIPDFEEENAEIRRQLRDRVTLRRPNKFDDFVMTVASEMHDQKEPLDYKEATTCLDREKWIQAMQQEIQSLKENQTWVMTKLPPGKKAIPNKWVFKLKSNPDGSVDKYKARLVIKGYSQRKGEDYDQTYSPVAKGGTIRALLSIAANKNMSLTQFDVCTAFLYGVLDEEIYMEQPMGYQDKSGMVCRLQRSLYGLKQAPRCWNKRFTDYIEKLDFKRSDADSCLFIKKDGQNTLLLALYVDDGLLASTDDHMKETFLERLKKQFKISAKPASYFLGLEINATEKGDITVSQSSYTNRILHRFRMQDCNPVSTPMVKDSSQLGKANGEEELNTVFPYREAVGALLYLMTCTRPDIAYSVSVASRKLENPTNSDCSKVKRIFRYLKATREIGLVYRSGVPAELKIFSDSDYGGDETTGRSTSGVVCMYAGGAVSWMSQRQTSVALSTTEAEIVAASDAAKEIVWMKQLYEECDSIKSVPILKVDNEAAIRLSQNPEFHRRTKHIHIRHFFVRELVQENSVIVEKVPSEFQLADLMTKPLFKPRLEKLREAIGMVKHSNEGRC